jgi:hypothetical protein
MPQDRLDLRVKVPFPLFQAFLPNQNTGRLIGLA